MTKKLTINRCGWLACWLQKRRRARQHKLLPAPVLVAQYPSLAVWEWSYANPVRWNAYNSLDEGVTYRFDGWVTGSIRQYAPDGGDHLMFIVGVDANGIEITERSNAIRPDDAEQPDSLNAPFLVSLGEVLSETTWRAVAPQAVDDWQFCTADTAYNPGEITFDQWIEGADSPDTAFVTASTTAATVTMDFTYCAARYRVEATWSNWTAIVDRTVIPPPAPVVTTFTVVDNGGMIDMNIAWTWDGRGWPDDGVFMVSISSEETQGDTVIGPVACPARNVFVGAALPAADITYYCRVAYSKSGTMGEYSAVASANPY